MKRSPLRKVSRQTRRRDRHLARLHEVVLERDDYRCQAVSFAGLDCAGPLEVHHITPRSVAPELVLDPENMVTVCATHHLFISEHPRLAHDAGLHRWSWEGPAA